MKVYSREELPAKVIRGCYSAPDTLSRDGLMIILEFNLRSMLQAMIYEALSEDRVLTGPLTLYMECETKEKNG